MLLFIPLQAHETVDCRKDFLLILRTTKAATSVSSCYRNAHPRKCLSVAENADFGAVLAARLSLECTLYNSFGMTSDNMEFLSIHK